MVLGCAYVVIGERVRHAQSVGAAVALDVLALLGALKCDALPGPGILELCLAALWRHYIGIALGLGVAKMGTSLFGMTLAARPPPPPSRGCLGWFKNHGRRLLMWGASKMQALFYMFRW
jgi:hypothetical protein